MNYILLLSIVSGIITILSWFISDKFRKNKIFLIAMIIIVTFLSSWITKSDTELKRIKNIHKSASQLVTKHNHDFTSDGFIQAALTFLEENKDIYPDAYIRATIIYETNKDKINVSYALKGMLNGIAILNKE